MLSEFILVLAAIYVFIIVVNRMSSLDNVKVGNKGEDIVRGRLKLLDSSYIVINNERCCGCQIDHLVIHHGSKTIFVIETKMWGGKITGKYDDKKWMQYNYQSGKIKFMDNPILQNVRHCNAVRRKYSGRGYMVCNTVVFVGNVNIPRFRCVISDDKLVNYISNKVSNRGIIGVETDWLSHELKV